LSKVLAKKGGVSERSQKHKEKLWTPQSFDPRLAAQQQEMTYLYTPIGLTNALPLPDEVKALAAEASEGVVAPLGAIELPPAASKVSVIAEGAGAASDLGPIDAAALTDSKQIPSNDHSFSAELKKQMGYY